MKRGRVRPDPPFCLQSIVVVRERLAEVVELGASRPRAVLPRQTQHVYRLIQHRLAERRLPDVFYRHPVEPFDLRARERVREPVLPRSASERAR